VTSIWEDYQETLLDVIVDALTRRDLRALRGIQCLDASTEWTGAMGVESVLNVLFRASFEAPLEARRIRDQLASEAEALHDRGFYEALGAKAERLERRMFPIQEVTAACVGLRHGMEAVNELYSHGLVRVERPDPADPEALYVGLSALWDGFLEEIEKTGEIEEANVYSSAMGKMLSIAMDGGMSSVAPLVLIAHQAEGKGGEATYDELLECCAGHHRPKRFTDNLLQRGQKRPAAIRPFSSDYGNRLNVNVDLIYVVGLWRARANARAAGRGLGGP